MVALALNAAPTNRAAALSGSAAVHAAPATVAQYLIFSLGQELFGIGTMRVREIMEHGSIASVPMMPAFFCGVINLRGAVVPVIDLNARFGRAKTQVSRRTCIVIVEVHASDGVHVLGIIVDTVSAVRQIDASHIEPTPHFGTGVRADFIDGMAKVNGSFVILLDLGKVLSVDEIALLSGAATATPLPEGASP